MLERLRMQEVKQIILSLPEGARINNTSYEAGEPILIIDKPNLSNLSVRTADVVNNDGRGFIGASTLNNRIDFTINEGSILYSVWSYLNGLSEENTNINLKGTEWILIDNQKGYLSVDYDSNPRNFIVYIKLDSGLHKLKNTIDYDIELNEEQHKYQITFNNTDYDGKECLIIYNYDMVGQKTNISQIHNNIFCQVDIYFDAIDMITDEHHIVCFHCDKAQIFTDMTININSSTQASFTPIRIISIPTNNKTNINKNIGYFTVI